ncbi:hypothetical protein TNCV_3038661 [Trichonephila clavipes]|nr:hypothetical protein TNCV_3038661 [Trichonephila clavipes]
MSRLLADQTEHKATTCTVGNMSMVQRNTRQDRMIIRQDQTAQQQHYPSSNGLQKLFNITNSTYNIMKSLKNLIHGDLDFNNLSGIYTVPSSLDKSGG